MHVSGNAEPTGKHLQLRLQRSFAGDQKLRAGIILFKNCESAQTGCDAFFRDQTASLDHFPFAVARQFSVKKWEVIEGNPRPIDAQLFRRTPQLGQPFSERLRTGKHEWDSIEKTP